MAIQFLTMIRIVFSKTLFFFILIWKILDRQHVIDCLPRVWTLDGVFISTSERNEIEEFFTQSSYTIKPVVSDTNNNNRRNKSIFVSILATKIGSRYFHANKFKRSIDSWSIWTESKQNLRNFRLICLSFLDNRIVC